MSPPRILVTGFGPFAGMPLNPCVALLEDLAQIPDIAVCLLDVDYIKAEEQLEAALVKQQPAAHLAFGVGSRGEGLQFERLAHNHDACPTPDNAGRIREGCTIRDAGPHTYNSTLPLDRMAEHCRQANFPLAFSDDAGGFLCNHIFYVSRHWSECSDTPWLAGFVHLPFAETLTGGPPWLPEAARLCIGAIAEGM